MVSIQFKVISDSWNQLTAEPSKSGIHSGNAGDIIFSLPTVRALGIRHLILHLTRSIQPFRALSERTARALVPLLLYQTFIDRVSIVSSGLELERLDPDCISVDYNLDRFRNEDTDNLHLIESHARAQGVCIDPNDAFLTAPKSTSTQGSPDVVMAFTPRHRVLTDDFIRRMVIHQKFRQPLILGIPEDWRAVAGVPGTLRTCEDMLEMARLINSAPVFIGSPSLASAIAEGLKAPRLVDLQSVSNDFPVGPGGFVIPTHIEELSLIFQHLGINGSSIRQSLD